MADFPELLREDIVFRGAIYKNWVKNNKVHWHAFRLRVEDEDGVSLSLLSNEFEGLNNPVEGVICLNVGRSRDCSRDEYNIDVIQDSPKHAVLTGLLCAELFEGDQKIKVYDDMKNLCIDISTQAAWVLSDE